MPPDGSLGSIRQLSAGDFKANNIGTPTSVAPRRRALFWLGWRLLWNHLRIQLTQAWLRSLFLGFVATTLWFSLAAFTRTAFHLLANTILPIHIVGHFSQLVLGGLAVALGGLVAFSAGLTCYLELFRAPDTPTLLCWPLRADQIFAFKWFRTLVPGMLILGLFVLPVVVEWNACLKAPWWSYVIVILTLAGFLVLAASFGCLVCLLVVWLIPSQSRRVLLVLTVVLVVAFAWWLGTLVPREHLAEGLFRWLRQWIRAFQPLQWFLAPSRWWSSALSEASQGHFRLASFSCALLWSNALALYLMTAWLAGRIYRRCYAVIAGLGDRRRAANLLARWPVSWLVWSSRPVATLFRKDLVTLGRDPVQWTQLGVLGALFLVYFWTISQLGPETLPFYLRRILHVLNLVMVALVLATWASRFVYPLVAQEIRAFWLLGMAPIRRGYVLFSKWLFSSFLGLGGAFIVVALSHWLLRMDAATALLHATAALVLGFSLTGASVGLGGLLVEPHEQNPARPLNSYGSALTLFVCTALALIVSALAALPVFFDFQTSIEPEAILLQGPAFPSLREWILCLTQILMGGTICTVLLYLGHRRFQRLQW